jgi:hypothetical protein
MQQEELPASGVEARRRQGAASIDKQEWWREERTRGRDASSSNNKRQPQHRKHPHPHSLPLAVAHLTHLTPARASFVVRAGAGACA